MARNYQEEFRVNSEVEQELLDRDDKIAELEKQLAEGEALVIELAAALEINQLRNE